MSRITTLPAATILLLAGCASHGSTPPGSPSSPQASPSASPPATAGLATLAERSGYTKTSPYDSVVAYLHLLVQRAHADSASGRRPHVMLVESTSGTTTEGRAMPYVILARPMVHSAREAHDSGRPVVYVEANIHAGEVEGKEAVLALMRDLAILANPAAPSVLDSIVLIVEPIYNADGNDHFAPQAINRTEQNGPEIVGERPNGQHLDLNRDFIKAEAPETRMTLGMFRDWDPNVFVDLHTTDGSFHGYALTYAPSLNPAAVFAGTYTRDSLLPVLRRRMHDRDHFEIFDYGNFEPERAPGIDTARHTWRTYDARPRFGTNYVGLRNRISILSEAYSHDPFARRVASTYAFVREILSLVAERRARILQLGASADSAVVDWGSHPGHGQALPIRSAFAPERAIEPVLTEDLDRVTGPGGDATLTQPGVPRGLKRSGRIHPVQMAVVDRFAPTLTDRLPLAYAVPAGDTAILRLLRLHGIMNAAAGVRHGARIGRAVPHRLGHARPDDLSGSPPGDRGRPLAQVHLRRRGPRWHLARPRRPAPRHPRPLPPRPPQRRRHRHLELPQSGTGARPHVFCHPPEPARLRVPALRTGKAPEPGSPEDGGYHICDLGPVPGRGRSGRRTRFAVYTAPHPL